MKTPANMATRIFCASYRNKTEYMAISKGKSQGEMEQINEITLSNNDLRITARNHAASVLWMQQSKTQLAQNTYIARCTCMPRICRERCHAHRTICAHGNKHTVTCHTASIWTLHRTSTAEQQKTHASSNQNYYTEHSSSPETNTAEPVWAFFIESAAHLLSLCLQMDLKSMHGCSIMENSTRTWKV